MGVLSTKQKGLDYIDIEVASDKPPPFDVCTPREFARLRAVLWTVCVAAGSATPIAYAAAPRMPLISLASAAIACAAGALAFELRRRLTIGAQLRRALGVRSLRGLHVASEICPPYRFVDLHRALNRFCEAFPNCVVIESHFDLLELTTIIESSSNMLACRPPRSSFAVGYETEQFLPLERFWIVREMKVGASSGHHSQGNHDAQDGSRAALVRLRIVAGSWVALEAASTTDGWANEIVEQIDSLATKHSIYRGRLLQASFKSVVSDDRGNVDSGNSIQISFVREESVTRDEIVLDDEVATVLERNVFDFHARREALAAQGVPSKKGLLFYGPPGTGKSFACKYIFTRLQNVTTIVVTGHSLLKVKSLCHLARMLQPSLLVLEDVDLIFAAREINLYSTALGDLMDQLDGFQPNDAVMFLLTTNAIDRLERAIKDRPGRISQCVYFGPPGPELRRRYLAHYLCRYDVSDLSWDALVELTEDCSQAFLKELVYRAVQVALESASSRGNGRLAIRTCDLEEAYQEMARYNEHASGAILGFQPRKNATGK